jgi:uncharacterized protein (TIRG00374 family)
MRYLKLVVGIVLLFALFQFGVLDLKSIALAASHPVALAAATVLLLGTLLVQSLRWHLLLRAQGFAFRWAKTLQIVLTGAFFSSFLPGAYGGDVVRAVYLYRATSAKQTSALLSVAMDRIVGLSGLLTLGLGVSLFHPAGITGASAWGFYALALAFLAGNAGVLLYGHRLARYAGTRLPKRLARLGPIVDQVSDALECYMQRWPTVVACWALSVVLFALAVGALLCVTAIFRYGSLTWSEYSIAGVWSILANALPFTPGGIGVGEGAFAQACLLMETAPSGAPYGTVFLVYRAINILSTVPGVIAYYLYRQETLVHSNSLPNAPAQVPAMETLPGTDTPK